MNEFTQKIHPGNFPIRVLAHNIIGHFETVRDTTFSKILKAVKKGKIKPGIEILFEKETLKTPYADCSQKKIHLQENYLGFLWAMCYSLFVIYEEGVQRRMISGSFVGIINYDTVLLERAKSLFDWALSLKDNYSNWDLQLPNPEKYNNETEEWYASKVNGIYQDLVVYDLFHEFAHLV